MAHNGLLIAGVCWAVFFQAWFNAGLPLIVFTDSAPLIVRAFFERGPVDYTDLVTGGYWSLYCYQVRISGTEIIRGIDVFALVPSEHISANEIAAAEMANQGGLFNPQQQFPVTWPPEPTVSLAYLDQWLRAHPDRHQTLDALYETLHAA